MTNKIHNEALDAFIITIDKQAFVNMTNGGHLICGTFMDGYHFETLESAKDAKTDIAKLTNLPCGIRKRVRTRDAVMSKLEWIPIDVIENKERIKKAVDSYLAFDMFDGGALTASKDYETQKIDFATAILRSADEALNPPRPAKSAVLKGIDRLKKRKPTKAELKAIETIKQYRKEEIAEVIEVEIQHYD